MNVMTDHLADVAPRDSFAAVSQPAPAPQRRGPMVLVVEDRPSISRQVGAICDYVGLTVETVDSSTDLAVYLDERRPVALVAPFEMECQDGAHILKMSSLYDHAMPVMILTYGDPAYLGAVEAMRDMLRLPRVYLQQETPSLGHLVEFLARAAELARRRRLDGITTVAAGGI